MQRETLYSGGKNNLKKLALRLNDSRKKIDLLHKADWGEFVYCSFVETRSKDLRLILEGGFYEAGKLKNL